MSAIIDVIRSSLFVLRKKQNPNPISDIRKTKNEKGFTLIELMITISIIAIISAIGLTTYSQTQKIARDAKRKQDLRAIAVALELYYQKNKTFPKFSTTMTGCTATVDTKTCATSSSNTPWIPVLDTNFINSLPKDPLTNNGDPQSAATNYGYGFRTFADNFCGSGTREGQYYLLYTKLENTADPESLAKKDQYLCPGVTSLTGAGYLGTLYALTSP